LWYTIVKCPGRLTKVLTCLPRGSSRNGYRERSVKEVMDNARTLAALTFLFMDLASSQRSNASPSCQLTVCISKTYQISLSDEHKVTCCWRGSPEFWALRKIRFHILQALIWGIIPSI
jgi:hypothetical protein